MLRAALTSLCCATALAVPVANALALGRVQRSATAGSKRVVRTVTVDGPAVQCPADGFGYDKQGAWGLLKLQLTVVKTEVTTGAHTSVSLKITDVSWPIFPNHTRRTIYISQQALPLLQQETLRLHGSAATGLTNISGATATTRSWQASLQGALLRAEKP